MYAYHDAVNLVHRGAKVLQNTAELEDKYLSGDRVSDVFHLRGMISDVVNDILATNPDSIDEARDGIIYFNHQHTVDNRSFIIGGQVDQATKQINEVTISANTQLPEGESGQNIEELDLVAQVAYARVGRDLLDLLRDRLPRPVQQHQKIIAAVNPSLNLAEVLDSLANLGLYKTVD